MSTSAGGRPSNVYNEIYKPEPGVPFISAFINKQSVILDTKLGTRGCILPTARLNSFEDVRTMEQLFKRGHSISHSMPCFGTRSALGKPFTWYSYDEIDKLIDQFGAGLRHSVGYNPDTDNFVGIYGRNSVEWMVTMHACARQSYVYIPLYATLGPQALQHIITLTNPKIIVCHSATEATCVLRTMTHSLQHIVVVVDSPEISALKKDFHETVMIHLFQEFVDIGKKHPAESQPPAPDQLFTISFTSGSTGIPKGVLINHQQIVNAIVAAGGATECKFVRSTIRHLCWLPLAHILEQLLVNTVILHGACAAFLTGGPETLLADIGEFRPTVLTAVPRILARIYKQYMEKFPRFSYMRSLLDHCISHKLAKQASGDYTGGGMLDYLFLRRLRDSLGGKICQIIVGGAPVVPHIAQFFQAALDAPVTVGYGSTECCGVLTETLVGESDYSVVGAIAPWTEIRLIDVPDMDLYVDRDGVGEICVRSLRCTKGYYKDEENTKSLFTDDGWMKTGDVGTWKKSGALAIVDRCKNLFKLAQGEYVASEKVEGIYQAFSAVLFSLVVGKPTEDYTVVIVAPDFQNLRSLYHSFEKSGDGQSEKFMSDAQYASSLSVRKFLLDKMNKLGRQRGLNGFELAKNIHISSMEFTVESGLLTPTFKLVRQKAKQLFAKEIDKLYEEGSIVTS